MRPGSALGLALSSLAAAAAAPAEEEVANPVTNGDFTAGSTGWTVVTPVSFTFSGGTANWDDSSNEAGTGYLRQTITIPSDGQWRVTLDLLTLNAGFFKARINGSESINTSTTGSKVGNLIALTAGNYLLELEFPTPRIASIDNVVVEEAP